MKTLVSVRSGLIRLTVLVIATVFSPFTDAAPGLGELTPLHETVVRISPAQLRNWAGLKEGDRLNLPWIDGVDLVITVTTVEQREKVTLISGIIDSQQVGGVVLAISDGRLTGAIVRDSEAYRLRTLKGEEHALFQVDPRNLMPDQDDTDSAEASTRLHGAVTQRMYRQSSTDLVHLPLRRLTQLVKTELGSLADLSLWETGSRIDILVVYSNEAGEWAENQGLNVNAEIEGMISVANFLLGASRVEPRLNLVGIAHVDHKVVDPAMLKVDLSLLSQGSGNLSIVHDLRDDLKADLVALLVFNGEEGCGVDKGRACGRALRPRFFPGPFDSPGSTSWENQFAANGFAVMGVHAAFNYYTFIHEIGHTLGAHHDVFTFLQDASLSTADIFARGWIMPPVQSRTVMAYDRICSIILIDCPIVPIFSNPLQTLLGIIRGDPEPGGTPTNFGPADNTQAINRMARTVASYRLAP